MLGYPFGVGEKITKAMPSPVMGKDVPLAKLFDREHPATEKVSFEPLYEGDPDVKTVVDTAKDLEGLKRQWGTRRWCDHVQRTADRHHPDHAPRAGWCDHHAVRLSDL